MLPSIDHALNEQTATVALTLCASLELSRSTWLATCLLPERDRMSKYSTPGGDGGALLGLLERMRTRAQQLTGRPVKIVVIQEAGLDGFWVHRLLEANGIESHVVDPASIAVPRRPSGAATHRSGADHRPNLPRHRPHSAAGLPGGAARRLTPKNWSSSGDMSTT